MVASRLILSAALCLPTATLAQITGEDVWAATRAAYEAFGLEVAAVTARDGDRLTVRNINLQAILPQGVGFIEVDLPPMVFEDLANGDVAMALPETSTYAFRAQFPDTGPVSGSIELENRIESSVVAGTPEDLTFQTVSNGYNATLAMPEIDFMTFDMTWSGAGYTSETRIAQGETLTLETSGSQLPTVLLYSFGGGREFASRSRSEIGDFSYASTVVLPSNIDLMNLSSALRSGLSLVAQTTQAYSDSETLTVIGDTDNYQRQVSGASDSSFRFDAEGLSLAASAESGSLVMRDAMFPVPEISVEFDGIELALMAPLLADTAPQSFQYLIDFGTFAVDDGLWDLVDPGRTLDRGPAMMRIDITGMMRLGQDLLDFETWMSMGFGDTPDIGLDSIRIGALDLAALGASMASTGAFTFDMDDLETFDGFPRPAGTGRIDITGAQTLIDQLEASGLVPADQISGARLGLGMVTRSTGPDSSAMEVEVTDDGQVLVNGIRMR